MTSAANSSRDEQMSAWVFLPAWLSRITWSTFDSSNLWSFARIVSGEPMSPLWRVAAVVGEGELEERRAVGAGARFLVGRCAHELRDDGDVRVRGVVAEQFLFLGERVVVRVHPGLRRFGGHELESQRPHAAPAGHANRLHLRTGEDAASGVALG